MFSAETESIGKIEKYFQQEGQVHVFGRNR